MELTFFAALAGVFVSLLVAAVWTGICLMAGTSLPSADQVVGLTMIGACAAVLLGWAVALLNP